MAVSVLEVAGATGFGSVSVSFSAVPSVGETVVVAITSHRTPPRASASPTMNGVTTWTQLYQPAGSRVSYWAGVKDVEANTTSIGIGFSGSAANGHATAFRVAGLTSLAAIADKVTATATSVTGPSVSAGPGQLVISTGTVASGTATIPSAVTPSTGWATDTRTDGVWTVGVSHRVPGSSEAHSTSAASSASVDITVATLVLGDADSPAAPEITLAATAAPATAAFTLTTPEPATEVTLAGTAQAATAAFNLSQPGVGAEITLAGTASPATARFTLDQPNLEEAATDRVNRSNGRTRVMEWTVEVEPPVVEPTRTRGHDYAVAATTPPPTLVDGRPT